MSVSGRAVVSSGEYEGRFHRNLLFAFLKKRSLQSTRYSRKFREDTHPHTHTRMEREVKDTSAIILLHRNTINILMHILLDLKNNKYIHFIKLK